MQLSFISFGGSLFKSLISETMRGKTLARIFLNHALSDVAVGGTILDLGASQESASYNRFLRYQKPYTVTRTDFYRGGEQLVQLDLEQPFQLPDASFDAVTCLNTLEHIYNYRNVMCESFRILKSGGTFVGGTPFLVNYHADPHDYFRYTHEAIERVATEAGFRVEKIVALGLGPSTIAAEFMNRMLPRFLRMFIVIPAAGIDAILLKLKPAMRGRYALGYAFICHK